MKAQLRLRHVQPKRNTRKLTGNHRRELIRLTGEQRATADRYAYLVDNALRKTPKIFAEDPDQARSIAWEALVEFVPRFRPELGRIEPYLIMRMRYALLEAAGRAGFVRHRIKPGEVRHPQLITRIQPISLDNFAQEVDRMGEVFRRQNYDPTDPATDRRARNRADWFEAFGEIIDSLKPESRAIIRGLLEGRVMKSIAADLDVCESRVSQMLPDILAYLGHRLRRAGLDGGPDA